MEANVFNDTLNMFYLWLYGICHMGIDHSYNEKGNPLPPLYGLLFLISSEGSFICTIPQDSTYHSRYYTSCAASPFDLITMLFFKWNHFVALDLFKCYFVLDLSFNVPG